MAATLSASYTHNNGLPTGPDRALQYSISVAAAAVGSAVAVSASASCAADAAPESQTDSSATTTAFTQPQPQPQPQSLSSQQPPSIDLQIRSLARRTTSSSSFDFDFIPPSGTTSDSVSRQGNHGHSQDKSLDQSHDESQSLGQSHSPQSHSQPQDHCQILDKSQPRSQSQAHLDAYPQSPLEIGAAGLSLSLSVPTPPSPEKRKRGGPVLRDAPKSPIRVNVKTSPIMQPSNAEIEETSPLNPSPTINSSPTFSSAVIITTTDVDALATTTIPSPISNTIVDDYIYGNPHNRSLEDLGLPITQDPPSTSVSPVVTKADFTTPDPEDSSSRALLPPLMHLSTSSPDIMATTTQNNHSDEQRQSEPIQNHTQSPAPDFSSHQLPPQTTTASAKNHSNSTKTSDESFTASTSSISISHPNENDIPEESVNGSSSSSHEPEPEPEPVAGFAYHHNPYPTRVASVPIGHDGRGQSTPNLLQDGNAIGRHLSPNMHHPHQRSSIARPISAYSLYSEYPQRGRSPGMGGTNSPHLRNPSASGRRSPDTRPQSYIDMLNTSYPQPAPAPISFDNSHLKHSIGTNASLLGTEKTLEMYRNNIKKTNDSSVQYSFAVFLISSAQEQALAQAESGTEATAAEKSAPHELIREAKSILQRLASSGYPFAQYYLADGYASGLFSKGKEDYNQAFPLFAMAAKHGHAESAYRAALCYEYGWGTRKDPVKALNFLRVGATKKHPGAMTRLGVSCLSGDLGERKYREGIKWLKLATEMADTIYPAAPYILGCMYEKGDGEDIFQDETYAAELFTQAAELGNSDASFRMGDAYEHGKLNCPRNPALSVHFYTDAAEKGNPAAMMGLCAWYMVGAEPILEKDEEEAYEWAKRAADMGYTKAEYAVGYFTEMGIGCHRDILEANVWYVKAAEKGDERAKVRITTIDAAIRGGKPMDVASGRNSNAKLKKGGSGSKKEGECVVM
ncbi:Protein SKT5 [Ceratocystis fimbriata CBS 114723]|uniref:Protein SKT5 n=1 Tax=Ceratocystis fimbriata CBS 114723 TaxID=1035309 RepID=A0A2C5XJ85_9PEZI|nr:Protein SKT5 [Ceratocystis fimbriata CBS 114723]